MKSLSKQVTVLRIVFGVIWLIDATFKWLPGFQNHFSDFIMMAADGQPAPVSWLFDLFMDPFMDMPHFFAVFVALAESVIALGLIFGVWRKSIYAFGMAFAFLIWAFGEGFGGPYGSGATDIGSAVIYIFVFWALLLLEKPAANQWSAAQKFIKSAREA